MIQDAMERQDKAIKLLAMQGHNENLKEKIREEGKERRVCPIDFSSPFYKLIPPFPSLQNLL